MLKDYAEKNGMFRYEYFVDDGYTGRMARSRQGKFGGGQKPLGLMRDPDDRGHLIIDPETAPVIRKIYDLSLDGWGIYHWLYDSD